MKRYYQIIYTFVVNLGLGLGYAVVLSQLLGLDFRGEVYSYQIPALVISTVLFSSIPQSIFELSKRKSIPEYSIPFLVSILSLLSLLGGLLGWLYVALSGGDVAMQWQLLGLLLVSQGFCIFTLELVKFNKNVVEYYACLICQPFFLLIFILLADFLGDKVTVEMAVYSIISAYSVSFLIMALISAKYFSFSKVAALSFSNIDRVFVPRIKSLLLFRLLGVLAAHIDKLLLTVLVETSVMGLVAVCASLETVSSRLFTLLANTKMNYLVNGSLNSRQNIMFFGVCSFIGLLGVLFAFFAGKWVLNFIFGMEFELAQKYLPVIIATSVVSGICNVSSQSWFLSGSYRRVYTRQVLGIIAILVGSFLFSVEDVALTVLYSAFAASLVRSAYTACYLDLNFLKISFQKK